jgi:hypothetical protein
MTNTMASLDLLVWLYFFKVERLSWLTRFCTLQQVMCRVAFPLEITPVKFQGSLPMMYNFGVKVRGR